MPVIYTFYFVWTQSTFVHVGLEILVFFLITMICNFIYYFIVTIIEVKIF